MVWYSESGVHPNTLVKFDPKYESFSSEAILSGGGVVRNMVATPDGKLYLACSGVNKVAVVVLPSVAAAIRYRNYLLICSKDTFKAQPKSPSTPVETAF